LATNDDCGLVSGRLRHLTRMIDWVTQAAKVDGKCGVGS
jgi:hypothetical protein